MKYLVGALVLLTLAIAFGKNLATAMDKAIKDIQHPTARTLEPQSPTPPEKDPKADQGFKEALVNFVIMALIAIVVLVTTMVYIGASGQARVNAERRLEEVTARYQR